MLKKFIERAERAYGVGAYTYTKTSLRGGTKSSITITCPDHGDFTIAHDSFLYVGGCYKCRGLHYRGYPIGREVPAKKGRPVKPKPAIAPKSPLKTVQGRPTCVSSVYILKESGGTFLKIGYSSCTPKCRCDALSKRSEYKFSVAYEKTFYSTMLCRSIEAAIKYAFPMGFASPLHMQEGASETTDVKYFNDIVKIIEAVPNIC